MATPSVTGVVSEENRSKKAVARPRVVSLGFLGPESVEWLWPGWIALGKVSILDGDTGLGKSTLLLDLAARVSQGEAPCREAQVVSRALSPSSRPRMVWQTQCCRDW